MNGTSCMATSFILVHYSKVPSHLERLAALSVLAGYRERHTWGQYFSATYIERHASPNMRETLPANCDSALY